MFLVGWDGLGWLVGWLIVWDCIEIVGEVVIRFFKLVVILLFFGLEEDVMLELLIIVIVKVVEVVGLLDVVSGKGFVVVKFKCLMNVVNSVYRF